MLSQLDPRIWAVLIALAMYPILYVKGRHDGAKLERADAAASVAQANQDALKRFEHQQRNSDEASTLALSRAIDDRNRAARADRVIAGMRATLDATQRNAASSLAAATKTVAAYRSVFESCTAEYRSMGAEAAGHASDSLMYQQAWPH